MMYIQHISAMVKKIIAILLFLNIYSSSLPAASMAGEDATPEIIRVGWFDYKGFFMKDSHGYRSGYAYDYLQELARYGGWQYEYIEASIPECMQMLADGRIDILGPVLYAPEREDIMAYTTYSLGREFSLLTVRATDQRYQPNQYSGFNGMIVGMLSGDYRKNWLEEYAQKHVFTYQTAYYSTPDQMNAALHQGEIDAILMTNMRIINIQERIVAQFAPVDFYLAAKKGNDHILKPINEAMEQIAFYHKGFQSELAQKYFSVGYSGVVP